MKMNKTHCIGCRDNFYNRNNMGLNVVNGKPECWSFKNAKLVKALDIPTCVPPPYKMPETIKPSCYHAPGYSRVKKDRLTRDGYWKM